MKKIWIKDIQKNYKKLILTLLIGIFTLFVIKHIHFNVTPSSPIGIYYSYKYNKFKKGDYVVYKMNDKYKKYVSPKFKDLLTIKKIVATYRDTIEIKNGNIYINGKYMGRMLKGIPTTLEEGKTTLSDDEVFTMSNRDDSLDGRYYGTIKIKDIKAKAILLKSINLKNFNIIK